jgi:two-component system, chemotaxis family, CheB/CheR fusion protein
VDEKNTNEPQALGLENVNMKQQNFPIVGLGASAGGLDALKRFFSKVPKKSGMAYIVVVHLDPMKPSLMPQLLQQVTAVPVKMAEAGGSIFSDNIYTIPPNKEANIFKGKIQLLDLMPKKEILPIDFFSVPWEVTRNPMRWGLFFQVREQMVRWG